MSSLRRLCCLTTVLAAVNAQVPEFQHFQIPQGQYVSTKTLLTSQKKPGPKLQQFSPFMTGKQSWFQGKDTITLPELAGFSSISQMPSEQLSQLPPTKTITQNFPGFPSPGAPNSFSNNFMSQSFQPPFPSGLPQNMFDFQPGFPPGFGVNSPNLPPPPRSLMPRPNNNAPNDGELTAMTFRKTFPMSHFQNAPSSVISPFLFQNTPKASSLAELAVKDFPSDVPTAAAFAMNTETLQLQPKNGKANQQQTKNSDQTISEPPLGPEGPSPEMQNLPKSNLNNFDFSSLFSKKSFLESLQSKLNNLDQQQSFYSLNQNGKNEQQLQNMNGM